MRSFAFLFLTLLCNVACGSDPAASQVGVSQDANVLPDVASPPASDAASTAPASDPAPAPPVCSDGPGFSGTYTVPVSDALAPYASFPVSGIDFCTAEGNVELAYALPESLLGKSTRVSFRGTYDTHARAYPLSGSDGTATCSFASNTWTCQERLAGLKIDMAGLQKQFAALSAAEQTARLSVASVFGQDPIGVLTFSTQ